jgi:hypothetical protein
MTQRLPDTAMLANFPVDRVSAATMTQARRPMTRENVVRGTTANQRRGVPSSLPGLLYSKTCGGRVERRPLDAEPPQGGSRSLQPTSLMVAPRGLRHLSCDLHGRSRRSLRASAFAPRRASTPGGARALSSSA